MEVKEAQEWLNLMIEVSVGVYVFFISVPSLLYGTFIPQELRELRGGVFQDGFKRPSLLIFLVIIISFIHFILWQLRPCSLNAKEVADIEKSNISTAFVIIVSLLFFLLLRSGLKFASTTAYQRGGYLKTMAENLKNEFIAYFRENYGTNGNHKIKKGIPAIAGILKKSSSLLKKEYTEYDYWRDFERLGKYTRPGSEKGIWIQCMRDIIKFLVARKNNQESLKKAVKLLSEGTGGSPDMATYENIKETLDIFRSLLREMGNMDQEDIDRFSECYEEVSVHLLSFYRNNEGVENIPTIVSTATLLPNHSNILFDICVIALKRDSYDILTYALSEIIGSEDSREEDLGINAQVHNFWGIYAALYMKGKAFRQYAEQIRKNAGIPEMETAVLKSSYKYHFDNANFEVANNLHDLIKKHS